MFHPAHPQNNPSPGLAFPPAPCDCAEALPAPPPARQATLTRSCEPAASEAPGSEEDRRFMALALEQAALAASQGEVPVGAVVVLDGQVVGRGRNGREGEKSALAHAELAAIAEANRALGGWRLHKCTLYVTLEPCPMCAGALINCRIKRVVFGAKDPKAGSFGSVVDLSALRFNHRPPVTGGVLADKCAEMLTDFFRRLRQSQE